MEHLKKKILFVASEAVPFAHTGGLGEVASALPMNLNRRRQDDADCRVIMPLYGSIGKRFRERMTFLGEGRVQLSWRDQYLGVFCLEQNDVTYYFIDNEYYFKRDDLYGYGDDCERYAYFSKAVFEALDIIGFDPDIIHANDWQAALVPVYQYAVYKRPFTRTVFTVHNIEYQGRYGRNVMGDIIDLPGDMGNLVEYNGDVNLMKGAIECADVFSTVSPTYAEELKGPEVGCGLDPIVRKNENKLRGILNGIDTGSYDPSSDNALACGFSWRMPDGKKICKQELQKEAGLAEADVPVIAMITRLVAAKGIDLLVDAMDRILDDMDLQFILLGTGDEGYEAFFRGLEQRHKDRARCMIEFNVAMSRRMYAGADIFLMPSRSEACGLAQMIACRYGTVPVVRQVGGLADSIKDCRLGEGSGFVFREFTGEGLYRAVSDAAALYAQRKDWNDLVLHDMKLDFGWKKAAEKYMEMYGSL